MTIKFKLYAGLRDYLSGDARRNGLDLEIPSDASPYDVIDRYRVPRENAHLMLLNGVYISPQERDKPLFKEGDTLAIWPPVAGG
jgi:molybdopterin converting factor small subunit